MNSVISIDWGGTKLSGVYMTLSKELNKFELPSQNIRKMPEEEMKATIKAIISQVGSGAETWLIGAAGAADKAVSNKLAGIIKNIDKDCSNVEIYTDCEANHAACFGGKDGVLCVAGTGFMVYAKNKGEVVTGGGYGYLIDRLPSGSYLGQIALEGLFKALDGFSEYEEYIKYAKELKLIDDKDYKVVKTEIIDELYQYVNPQRYLARFSVLADSLLRHHEYFAIKSTLAAFDNLKVVAQEVVQKLYKDETKYMIYELPLKMCGAGGLWDNMKDFPELCCSAFEKVGCVITLMKPVYELCYGPLVVYSQNNEKAAEILKQIKGNW